MERPVTVRIDEKAAFTCVGRRLKTGSRNSRFFKDIAAFREENEKNGYFRALASLAGNGDQYDICDWSRYQQGEDEFKFDIVFTIIRPVREVPAELELEEFTIPAQTWVVFSVQGPVTHQGGDAMGTLNDYAPKWLEDNDYDRAFDYEIDHFPEGDRSSDDYVLTKWIPISEKE
jgi:AraC family transcriptional regulator